MSDPAVRRLYAQVLLNDEILRGMLVTWLAGMSPDESEALLGEYAAMLDPIDPKARNAWLVKVRTDATLLRTQRVSAQVH